MPSLVLTDRLVKGLKGQVGKQIEYNDTNTFGLSLRVSPAGTKTWNVRYTPLGEEKQKRVPIGHLHADGTGMSLADARAKAHQMQSLKWEGADLNAFTRATIKTEAEFKAEARKLTLGEAMKQFLVVYMPTLSNDDARAHARWYFDKPILGELGADRPLIDITRNDLLKLVAGWKENRGGPTANRARNKLNKFFQWASDPDRPDGALIPTDLTATIKKPHKETHKAKDKRFLTDDEWKLVMRTIMRSNSMHPETKFVLQIMSLTSRRPKEVCGIKRNMIQHLDQADGFIDFPAALMKTKVRYILPITPELRDVLRAALWERDRNDQMVGKRSEYLFRTHFRNTRGDVPVSPNAVAQAFGRLIDAMVAETPEEEPIVAGLKADRPSPYALRRTANQVMGRLKVSREDRKLVMAHAEDDVMAEHYEDDNPHEFDDQKREALLKLQANRAALMRSGRYEDAENVVEMWSA